MTDLVSLEIVFDDETDAAIRAEWDALAAAGLPSQARHTGETNRPHITMLVRPELGALEAGPLSAALPLELRLGAPLLFGVGRSRVIARSVVPSSRLLALHERVHAQAGLGGDVDHTRPGNWTPHVTLARRVALDRVGEALQVWAESSPVEVPARAVAIRRWETATRTVSAVA